MLVLLLVCAISSSCGYRLSGQTAHEGRMFSPVLKKVSIQNLKLYDEMRSVIVGHLKRYGIQTVTGSQSVPKIVIESNELKERRAVVGDRARTREILLSLEVVFSVIYGDRYLLRNQKIYLQDTYLYNINALSRNRNERDRILDRIYQQTADHIINHLATIRVKTKKPKTERKTTKTRGSNNG